MNKITAPVRVAILGNYAMQFMERCVQMTARRYRLSVESYVAEYGTTDMELLDPGAGLYTFQPSFVLWHESTLGLRDQFYALGNSERAFFAQAYVERCRGHLDRIARFLPSCKVIIPVHAVHLTDNIFGHFGNKLTISWQYQSTKLNYLLHELATVIDNLILVNGRPEEMLESLTDFPMTVNADLHYSLSYLDWVSDASISIIRSQQGKFHKCVILDLDNTLWGGIIGDDGIEGIQVGSLGIGKAFTRFQRWLKELVNRGIILAVCSKNDEDIAKMAFLHHPEMVLRLEDISVFMANWDSKADNIARIQQVLNIGFDAMVFLDDNPAERDIVRKHLPDVTVPELPEDPALYLPFIIAANLFETPSYSGTDHERTRQYQEESKRQQLAQSVTNMDDFLESLQMVAKISCFRQQEVERISQLTLRSNQFNLRTVRYSVAEVKQLIQDEGYETFSVELKDTYGNYGLISLVIIQLLGNGEASIDTWIMSCRVLKRTVEELLLNQVVERLRSRGISTLHGEYLPTAKNKLVKDLLPKLGFQASGENHYRLDISTHRFLQSKISIHGEDDQ